MTTTQQALDALTVLARRPENLALVLRSTVRHFARAGRITAAQKERSLRLIGLDATLDAARFILPDDCKFFIERRARGEQWVAALSMPAIAGEQIAPRKAASHHDPGAALLLALLQIDLGRNL